MKNLFPENSLHYYKKGKSKMIKPLGIFRFQGVLSAYYTIPKINRELQPTPQNVKPCGYYTIPKINRELQRGGHAISDCRHYTIPKINRELQLPPASCSRPSDYTIPKINRELQLNLLDGQLRQHYTIPKINRELQPFIRCQKNVFLGEQILKKVLTNSF